MVVLFAVISDIMALVLVSHRSFPVGADAGAVTLIVLASILLAAALMPKPSLRWAELVVIALIGSVGLVFALFLSTSVFRDGPLLTETKLGAIGTLAGGAMAVGAARVLRVGRFA